MKQALARLKGWNGGRGIKCLDIFAGTGCIGIAVLKNLNTSKVDFADISGKAADRVRANLKLNKIPRQRCQIYKSDLFKNLKREKYDVIFANPPYVAIDRISEVQKEVLKTDPHLALFAGKDGMETIKKFLPQAKNHLKKEGAIFMEFDPLQMGEIKKILLKIGLKADFYKDQFKKYRWLQAGY